MTTFNKSRIGAVSKPRPRTKPKKSKFKRLLPKSGAVKRTRFQKLAHKATRR